VVARRERVQSFGQIDVRLVRGDVEARVRIELELSLGGPDHLRRRVTDVQDRDAGREVDQPVAVDVLDDCAGGPRRHDRVDVRDALRHRARPALEPLARPRSGDLRDDLALLRDVHACLPVAHRLLARRSMPGPPPAMLAAAAGVAQRCLANGRGVQEVARQRRPRALYSASIPSPVAGASSAADGPDRTIRACP
jgi:hypothetical protein